MHPVTHILHNRMAGKTDSHRIAIVAGGGGQRGFIAGGMLARARAHGLTFEIMGGSSGGGLGMLYFAAGHGPEALLVLRHQTQHGFNRKGGPGLNSLS